MMRVMGRTGLMATAMAVFAASSAFAAKPAPSTDVSAIPGGTQVGPRTFNGTGFEVSEGYNVGTLSNVNGWDCFGSANATPPGPRCPSGVVAKGNGSAQGLMLDQNLNFPNGTNVGVFSPPFKDFNAPLLNFDIRMDDAGNADYFINPQTPSQGFTTARVNFSYTGAINILDDLDGPGPGTLSFVQAGNWDPNVWATFQIEMDVANLAIKYYIGPDKDNLTQIYTSYMFGGTIIEEVVLFSDNFQNFGGGSFSGGPVAAYMDNVVSKPEPGTLAMLGIGALLALRRRAR